MLSSVGSTDLKFPRRTNTNKYTVENLALTNQKIIFKHNLNVQNDKISRKSLPKSYFMRKSWKTKRFFIRLYRCCCWNKFILFIPLHFSRCPPSQVGAFSLVGALQVASCHLRIFLRYIDIRRSTGFQFCFANRKLRFSHLFGVFFLHEMNVIYMRISQRASPFHQSFVMEVCIWIFYRHFVACYG